jgi:hypothetical protein
MSPGAEFQSNIASLKLNISRPQPCPLYQAYLGAKLREQLANAITWFN